MEHLKHVESVKNAVGWWLSPLPQVGSTAAGLRTTLYGLDSMFVTNYRSQSYTTWACMSRTYYAGAVVKTKPHTNVRWRKTLATDDAYKPVTPTSEQLSAMSTVEQRQYKSGLKLFIKGK